MITTFDVVHDTVDPLGLLQAVRRALKPDGIYVCLDVNCSDKLEENAEPLGTYFHGASVFYCMATSLAQDGEGLGTLGLREPKIRDCVRRRASAAFGACRWRTRSTYSTRSDLPDVEGCLLLWSHGQLPCSMLRNEVMVLL